MTAKRAASLLLSLSLVTISLLFAAAQRAPYVPGDNSGLPGAPPFALRGPTGPGGLPQRGQITPADLAHAAAEANVTPSQLSAALASPSTNPIFLIYRKSKN